mgnify:CR=1 FL=1|tara:strand:+ start:1200 stop:2399 length:1200 start_codon:yes stop_codon:yes gene_type:complete
MAVPFVVPFVTGVLREDLRQKEAYDKLAGDVVDNVSEYILGTEIPNETKLVKAQEELKKGIASAHGQPVADAFDALKLFADGTDLGLAQAIKLRFGENYDISRLALDINNTYENNKEGYEKLVQTSSIANRKAALTNRKTHVDKILSDTQSIKDLLVGDEKPTGIAKYIGAPLGERDRGIATKRVMEGLEGPEVAPTTPTASASDILGIETAGTNITIQEALSLNREARQEFNALKYVDSNTGMIMGSTPYDNLVPKGASVIERKEIIFDAFKTDFINELLKTANRPQLEKPKPLAKGTSSADIGKTGTGKVKQREKIGIPSKAFAPPISDYLDTPEDLPKYNSKAVTIANQAYNRILEMQNAEARSGTYDASADIDQTRTLARDLISKLGEDPTKYGF